MQQYSGKHRVALFIPNFRIGGAERQALELATFLNQDKYEVIIIALRGDGSLSEHFRSLMHVRVVIVDGNAPFSAVLRLMAEIRKSRIQILHSFLLATNVYSLFAALFLPRLKVIIALRDAIPDSFVWYSSRVRRLQTRILIFCLRSLRHFADLFISNSRAGKGAYESRFGIRSIVIPNGIDTEKFKPDEAARSRLRDLVGTSADAKLIGILANCTPHKDYPTFIRAAKQIVEKRQDLHFVSFGDNQLPAGKRAAELVKEFGLRPFVHFLGMREDVHKLLPGLDVLCSSSVTEGFPNAIAEAMACGVPCVVTDVGDSRKIVGDIGIVVPPQNPEALATGVMSQLDLSPVQRERLAAASRERIVQNFGIAQMTARHEQLYDLVLSRPSHGPDWVTTSA